MEEGEEEEKGKSEGEGETKEGGAWKDPKRQITTKRKYKPTLSNLKEEKKRGGGLIK